MITSRTVAIPFRITMSAMANGESAPSREPFLIKVSAIDNSSPAQRERDFRPLQICRGEGWATCGGALYSVTPSEQPGLPAHLQ